MLVLSRKIGQRIVLPEAGVNIAVLGVGKKRVRLGIEAPPEASVYREELWQQILDLKGPVPEDLPVSEPAWECSPT